MSTFEQGIRPADSDRLAWRGRDPRDGINDSTAGQELAAGSPRGTRPDRTRDVDAPISTSKRDITILDTISSAAARQVTATTVIFAAIGFVLGFVLALSVAAYSLYVCTTIS